MSTPTLESRVADLERRMEKISPVAIEEFKAKMNTPPPSSSEAPAQVARSILRELDWTGGNSPYNEAVILRHLSTVAAQSEAPARVGCKLCEGCGVGIASGGPKLCEKCALRAKLDLARGALGKMRFASEFADLEGAIALIEYNRQCCGAALRAIEESA